MKKLSVGLPFRGQGKVPVSYTHLDVYKRQSWDWLSRGSDDYGSAYQAEATGGSQPHEHPLEGTTNQADSLPPFLSFHMVMRTA